MTTHKEDSDDRLVTVDRDGTVAVIRLNRPPLNALNRALREAFADAVQNVAASDARAIVVVGNDRALAAGAGHRGLNEATPAEMAGAVQELQDSLGILASSTVPTVVAINGFALGGGLEIALAADRRIASTDAVLGLPEVSLGLIPGGGGTQRLTRTVGLGKAKDLLMTGRQINAEEALRIGLVDEVVEPHETLSAALSWAHQFDRSAPRAVAAAKTAAEVAADGAVTEGLGTERRLFLNVFATEDARAVIQSFIEIGPGKARFTGR
jgi:enoyl-CoA hydratase